MNKFVLSAIAFCLAILSVYAQDHITLCFDGMAVAPPITPRQWREGCVDWQLGGSFSWHNGSNSFSNPNSLCCYRGTISTKNSFLFTVNTAMICSTTGGTYVVQAYGYRDNVMLYSRNFTISNTYSSYNFNMTGIDSLVLGSPTMALLIDDIDLVVYTDYALVHYPLNVDLSDTTGHYGNMNLSGVSPPAGSLCVNGIYPNYGTTPVITKLNPNDFAVMVDFMLNSYPPAGISAPIIIGGTGTRWISIRVDNNGKYGFGYNNVNVVFSNQTIPLNVWQNAVLIHKSGRILLLLDGEMILDANIPALTHSGVFNFSTTDFGSGKVNNICLKDLIIINNPQLAELCDGDSYAFGSQTISSSGLYTETFPGTYCCDSTAALFCIVHPVYSNTTNATINVGDIYTWHGGSYSLAGVYYDSLITSRYSCDSVFQLNLNVSPLPVELLDFNARVLSENTVAMNWSTASETNNNRFIIDRSFNNLTWDTIAVIPGTGNSNVLVEYQAFDYLPYAGISYYRLHQEDFDGSTEVLGVREVFINDDLVEITMFPNPTETVITVSSQTDPISIVKVLGVSGEDLTSFVSIDVVTCCKIVIDVSVLESGVYLLQAGGASSLTQKVFLVRR